MNFFCQNTKLLIHENASQNIVCETEAILSKGDEFGVIELVFIRDTKPVSHFNIRTVFPDMGFSLQSQDGRDTVLSLLEYILEYLFHISFGN